MDGNQNPLTRCAGGRERIGTNAKNGEAKRETQITKKPRHSHQSWETMNGTKGRNEDKRLR